MSEPVPVVDAVSVKKRKTQPLYVDHNRVYPKRVSGLYRRIKWWVLGITLSIYYVTPWLRWDRGPGVSDQAVLIDMPGRRAYFFFIEIWPQEVYYLAGLLILAAVALFLVSSLAGRMWCGYSCPQTVWTDLFMWVERRVEGDRNARMKLDQTRFNRRKSVKKLIKHSIWLLISALTGGAWIMYFNDAPTVAPAIFTGAASANVYFFFGLFTLSTYVLAGWAREQVCTYMCPWPRFQAALLDEHSLIVTYQAWRGEPRGRHHKGEPWDARGHCIDCNQCVAVCPTGIDIRDGQQLECIGCGLCIDACDGVMAKIDLPAGLIKFDTVARQETHAAGLPGRYRLVRPRTILYGALLVVIAAIMAYSLATRARVEVSVLHDRSPLFVALSGGDIRNGYDIKILNMTRQTRSYRLEFEGPVGAVVDVIGVAKDANGAFSLEAIPDDVSTYKVYVRAPRAAVPDTLMTVDFAVTDLASGERAAHSSVFRGPER